MGYISKSDFENKRCNSIQMFVRMCKIQNIIETQELILLIIHYIFVLRQSMAAIQIIVQANENQHFFGLCDIFCYHISHIFLTYAGQSHN